MREIKFRAWTGSQMIDIGDYYYWFEENGIARANDLDRQGIILMQYTGLKDKNGKEIYEGDVVRWTLPKGWKNPIAGGIISNDTTTISEVVFNDGGFELRCIEQDYANGWRTPLGGLCHRNTFGEVIGNVYENPELIEDKA